MSHYADSSVLVSHFGQDVNTAAAQAWLSSQAVPLPFTALHWLEIRNGFSLQVFRGLLNPAQVTACWLQVKQAIHTAPLRRQSVRWHRVFQSAVQLAATNSQTLGTRSFDVLHVALALHLGTKQFFTFDVRQRALAKAVGMNVMP